MADPIARPQSNGASSPAIDDALKQVNDDDVLLRLLEELTSRVKATNGPISERQGRMCSRCLQLDKNENSGPESDQSEVLKPLSPGVPDNTGTRNGNDFETASANSADYRKDTQTQALTGDYKVERRKSRTYIPLYVSPGAERTSSDQVYDALDVTTKARVDELLRLMGNVTSTPEDGRLTLSPTSRDPLYLDWTFNFYRALRACRGDFWIRDYDAKNNVKHYHYRHVMCRNRAAFGGDYTSEDETPYNTVGDIYAHDKSENDFYIPLSAGIPIPEENNLIPRKAVMKPGLVAPWRRIM